MKLQSVSPRRAVYLSRGDGQVVGSLEVGHKGSTPTTTAFLKVPTLTTAQREALTAEAGMHVYDTTLGQHMLYAGSGWGTTNGTAAGSLDAAYNGGSAVTVDASAVALTSSLTTAGLTLTGNSVTTNQVAVITGTGVTSGTVLRLAAVEATLTSGFYLQAYDGAASDFTIGKYGATVIAGNAATDVLTITAGHAVLTSGNLTLSSGNVDVTGTLAVSGTSTLAAITSSGTLTSDGKVIIDISNAEALLIRQNGGGTSVFTVDTTSDAGDTNVLVTVGITTGVGLAVNADTVTTGAGLRVDVEAATMTSGKAILVRDGTTSVFSVADDGATVIKGTAEGTAALTLTTGDLVISDGDLTLSAGEFAVTDGVTTTGSGFSLTSSITSSSAGAFLITANSTTSGVVGLITSSGTMVTTGSLLTLTANSATTAAGILRINANGLTSGIGAVIASSATAITGAGRLLRVAHTGATSTSGILSEFASAANDETVILRVTASDALALGNIVDISGAAMTTGTALDIGNLDALTSGIGVNVVSNSSDTGAFTLVYAKIDHASATGGVAIEAENDSTGNTVVIDHNGITGKALYIDAQSTTQTGGIVDIEGDTLTTGKVIDISNLDALTTGKALHIDATGVTQTDGILVHIDSASTALTSTGRLLLVDHTGNAGVSTIIAEIASAATDETTVLRVTASAALAAGVLLDLSGAAVTTGTILDLGGLDALTTGTAINLVSNSSSNGTRTLFNVKNDHASATGTTPVVITNDAPTSTNFFVIMKWNTVTLWAGNGNTPNTALSGTAGDILFGGDSGKAYYCTGTTNWTALA